MSSLLDNRHSPLTGASGDYQDGMWHRKKGAVNPFEQPKEPTSEEKLAQALADIEDLKKAVCELADHVRAHAAQLATLLPPETPASPPPAPAAPTATAAPSPPPAPADALPPAT